MPPGMKPLTADQIERLLELPKLDTRSRQALLDHAAGPVGIQELRELLRQDPGVARVLKTGGRFIKAAIRAPLLILFPEHAGTLETPRALVPAAPRPVAPPSTAFSQDQGLEKLDQALETLLSRPNDGALLKLKLHRINETVGFEKKVFTGISVELEPSELEGPDLRLEERTQQYAERAGLFGKYVWSIQAFLDGSLLTDTTRTINVEAPPDYRAPLAVQSAAPPTPPPDPRGEVRESLSLVKDLAGVVGLFGGKGGGMTLQDVEAARTSGHTLGHQAGKLEGLRQADQEWERKLDAKVSEAKAESYRQGKVDGRREAEDQYREEKADLERRAEGEGPGTVEQIVSAIGGPGAVQGLVAAIAGGLLSKKSQPAAPAAPAAPVSPQPSPEGRPPMALGPRPLPPAPEPAAAPAPPEGAPSMGQMVEAIRKLDDVIALLEEGSERGPEGAAETLAPQLNAFRALRQEGLEPKQVTAAAWWQLWTTRAEKDVDAVTAAMQAELDRLDDEDHPEETMPNVESLKALLSRRLEEGAAPAAIVEELRTTVPPATFLQWRNMVNAFPGAMVLAYLGIPSQHNEAGAAVLEAFRAAS